MALRAPGVRFDGRVEVVDDPTDVRGQHREGIAQ
jgi:hypothetical protein